MGHFSGVREHYITSSWAAWVELTFNYLVLFELNVM